MSSTSHSELELDETVSASDGCFIPPPASDSRHHQLLHSNELPSPFDIPIVESYISQHDLHLERIQVDLEKIRATLRPLERVQDLLLSTRRRHQAIVSPLRRLPAEVLSEIFHHSLPDTNDLVLRRSFNLLDSPWVVTHVSRRWRTVAMETRALWSRTMLYYSRHVEASKAFPMPMLRAQVERAQNLKIYFHASAQASTIHQAAALEFLVSHSNKWVEANLELSAQLVPMLVKVGGRVPLLRKLWLQWDESGNEGAPVDMARCLMEAPSLSNVGVLNRFMGTPGFLPLHQLTHYQLDAPLEVHHAILSYASRLIEAHIVVVHVEDDESLIPSTPIVVHTLERMCITNPTLLSFVNLPALKELTVSFELEPESGFLSRAVSDLVVRSSCFIRRLCFDGHVNETRTIEVLACLPSVTELGFIIDDDGALALNKFLHALAANEPEIAPQLRHVFIGCDKESFFDYKLFFQLIRARWRNGLGMLESALVAVHHGPPPALADVEELKRGGFGLAVVQQEEAGQLMDRWIYHQWLWI
ncbi:unnamed protein product [Mycena citricolor]|uniref:F-box domain-containing protein n=1 Tax=Mycena citricolor TaxID=2018698 RepID=A0AAD2HYL3_9AGAR|nr:unnamed protein product [Mycena citricolor]CAK5283753.1 unnamed protein product [Mycena citricolor]